MDTPLADIGPPEPAKPKPKAKKRTKPKAKKKRLVKPRAKKRKAAKSKAKKKRPVKALLKAARRAVKHKLNGDARSERLDMRLTKAQKAKIDAKAKKTRRTVTSLVIEAIEKIR
jgi:hypothetical protein